jgi:hypothetical protein
MFTPEGILTDWATILFLLLFFGALFSLVYILASSIGKMRAETKHARRQRDRDR